MIWRERELSLSNLSLRQGSRSFQHSKSESQSTSTTFVSSKYKKSTRDYLIKPYNIMSSSQSTNQSLDQTDHTAASNPDDPVTPALPTPEEPRRTGDFSLFRNLFHGGANTSSAGHPAYAEFPTSHPNVDAFQYFVNSFRRGGPRPNPTESSRRTQAHSNDIVNPENIMPSSLPANQPTNQTNNSVASNPDNQSTPVSRHEESQSTTTQASSNQS